MKSSKEDWFEYICNFNRLYLNNKIDDYEIDNDNRIENGDIIDNDDKIHNDHENNHYIGYSNIDDNNRIINILANDAISSYHLHKIRYWNGLAMLNI